MKILNIFTVIILSLFSSLAMAKGGGHSMQFSFGFMSADQGDTNTWIDSIGAVGTKNLGTGYEFLFDYQYRFSGSMFALKFRPGFFTQSADGGNVKAAYTGLTLYPMLRMYPLESNFMKFLLQVGVGFGSVTGEWENGANKLSFSGSNFGAIAGMGAEFCFTANHCMTIEGNLRYLPIPRNMITSGGAVGGAASQTGTGQELEVNSRDVETTLSGFQGIVSYQLYF